MEQDEALIFLEAYGDEFRSLAATTGDQAYRDTAVRALRVELGATMAPLVAAKLGVAVADLLLRVSGGYGRELFRGRE